MASDKLRSRVDHDIGAPLDGPHQRRRGRRVIDHQRNAALMRDLRQPLDVGDIKLRIAERLRVQRLGPGRDRRANPLEVVGIDELHRDSQPRQRVVEEIVRSAVERCRRDNLVARARKRGDRQRLGRLPGGCRQAGHAALQRRNPLLEDIGRRIHDAGVDVAELLQSKEAARVRAIVEDVAGRLVDRHSACLRGLFNALTAVQGQGGKVQLLGLVLRHRVRSLVGMDFVQNKTTQALRRGSFKNSRCSLGLSVRRSLERTHGFAHAHHAHAHGHGRHEDRHQHRSVFVQEAVIFVKVNCKIERSSFRRFCRYMDARFSMKLRCAEKTKGRGSLRAPVR